jgi:Raf kinase inhibitor-like YbhB/YbcL family protein
MRKKIYNWCLLVFIIFFVLITISPLKVQRSTDTVRTYKTSNYVSKKMEFNLSSTSFNAGDTIPTKYVCKKIPDGENISIPFQWSGAPPETKSYAILMYDLNSVAKNFVHWAVINIPSNVTRLSEGASLTSNMPNGSIELKNTSGNIGYTGPCPPKGTGKHEYKTIVYALNVENTNLSGPMSLSEFQAAIKDNIISQTELSGYFEQ